MSLPSVETPRFKRDVLGVPWIPTHSDHHHLQPHIDALSIETMAKWLLVTQVSDTFSNIALTRQLVLIANERFGVWDVLWLVDSADFARLPFLSLADVVVRIRPDAAAIKAMGGCTLNGESGHSGAGNASYVVSPSSRQRTLQLVKQHAFLEMERLLLCASAGLLGDRLVVLAVNKHILRHRGNLTQ